MLYDPESNLLSWELSKDPIASAMELGNFIFHLSKTSKPVLIEILDASKFVGKFARLKEIREIKQALPAE